MQMREFFNENFAERVAILLNCPKGRSVILRPSVRGIMGRSKSGKIHYFPQSYGGRRFYQ